MILNNINPKENKRLRLPLPLKIGMWLVLSIFISVGCANRGAGPQGGVRDENPPVLIKSNPLPNQTNISTQKVVLEFDEIVLLESAAQKVVVSPPQSTQPIVKAISKKVIVELPDTLLPNTTYTIDFNDAIVDNNEKNKLMDFALSFSTGDVLDSLQISGIVLNAANLDPLADIYVGIHSDLSDTAFTTKRFDRITKTNSDGAFTVRNIKPGSYRVYALNDAGNNYMYDAPTEQIAFLDSIYVPDSQGSIRMDTIWKPKYEEEAHGNHNHDEEEEVEMVIDTIIARGYTIYTPNDLLMRAFSLPTQRQYLVRNERKDRHKLTFFFNIPVDSAPTLKPINFDETFLLQSNLTGDTLHYWLRDSIDIQKDTLIATMTYQKTDSLGVLQWQTDTVRSLFRAPRNERNTSRKKDDEKKKIDFIKISSNISSKFDVYKPINLTFDAPTYLTDSGHLVLQQQVDTLWRDIPITLEAADSIGMKYLIHHKWLPETTYRLVIDSASFQNIYGVHNNKFMQNLTVRSLYTFFSLIKYSAI